MGDLTGRSQEQPGKGFHQDQAAAIQLFDSQYNEGDQKCFHAGAKISVAGSLCELSDVVVQNFYQNVAFLGYKNHRLLAVDGGFLNLPDHPSIREEFEGAALAEEQKRMCPKACACHRYSTIRPII